MIVEPVLTLIAFNHEFIHIIKRVRFLAITIAIKALQLKDQHNEQKRLYLECKKVEKALLRHMQDTLEDKYVAAIVDKYTNLITIDIPRVLDYLLYNFGKVSLEEVSQKELEVISITWLPSDSIILLTRPLEQLEKLV